MNTSMSTARPWPLIAAAGIAVALLAPPAAAHGVKTRGHYVPVTEDKSDF